MWKILGKNRQQQQQQKREPSQTSNRAEETNTTTNNNNNSISSSGSSSNNIVGRAVSGVFLRSSSGVGGDRDRDRDREGKESSSSLSSSKSNTNISHGKSHGKSHKTTSITSISINTSSVTLGTSGGSSTAVGKGQGIGKSQGSSSSSTSITSISNNNSSNTSTTIRRGPGLKNAIQNINMNINMRRQDQYSKKWNAKERNYTRTPIPRHGSGGNRNHNHIIGTYEEPDLPVFVDAGMERQIAAAARRLGDDIQHVVFAAKQGNQLKRKSMAVNNNVNDNGHGGGGGIGGVADEWKDHLLHILGGSDEYVRKKRKKRENGQDNSNDSGTGSDGDGDDDSDSDSDSDSDMEGMTRLDVDTLLAYSTCDKFVLRCLENELPPNLIHCMRLLRVLELQMAHSYVASRESEDTSTSTDDDDDDDNDDDSHFNIVPSSKEATKKVEKLLCILCSDPSVGEQLRPHLFGLLALSGASYPTNAVHVAFTASNVIVAIANDCLNTNLAYFLQDRQMIVHMTDDVKELCGMTNNSSSNLASYCLQGRDAEPHGLWFFALRAIVYLVRESCRKNYYGLLKDFYTAGGYHVLCYAIANSGVNNMKKIMELALLMVSCQTEEAAELGLEDMSIASASTINSGDDHLASNPGAFDIIENLMYGAVPLLIDYREKNNGAKFEIGSGDSLRELAKSSIQLTFKIFSSKSKSDENTLGVDKDLLSCEILLSTMQLYSDHPLNYHVIEDKYNVLSRFLLAYTTFTSIEVKQLVLRTLEYVCTGITDADCSKPLHITAEVFFCLCKTLFRLSVDEERMEESNSVVEALTADTSSLCDSLEKLLEVEDTLSQILIECGILGDLLDEFLALIMTLPSRRDRSKLEGKSTCPQDSFSEGVDMAYCAICRIINLIVKNSVATVSAATSPRSNGSGSPIKSDIAVERRRDDLNLLLTTGIAELGVRASKAALTVFESKLSYGDDTALQTDMQCIVQMFDYLAKNIVSRGSIETVSDGSLIHDNEKSKVCALDYIMIARNILEMLKGVLVESKSAQDTFRSNGGYESIIRLLSAMEEAMPTSSVQGNEETLQDIFTVVEIIFGVFDASMMPTERENKRTIFFTSPKSLDLRNDKNLIIQSPAFANRLYFRERGFHESFISALHGLSLFESVKHTRLIINLAFSIFEPTLSLKQQSGEEKEPSSGESDPIFLRNPDALRLILNIVALLPPNEPFLSLMKECFSVILELCSPEKASTTLGQIADTGLCTTLTSNHAYTAIFDNTGHPLHSLLVTLLTRIASFKMSFNDFVGMLRGIAGPVFDSGVEQGQSTNGSNITLPIICSAARPNDDNTSADGSPPRAKEDNLSLRLQTLADIAERGDRISRCLLGGGTIEFHEEQDRANTNFLYELAEQGCTRFIEVGKVDANAEFTTSISSSSTSASTNSAEKLWTPASTSGFSFSLWLRLHKAGEMSGNIFVFDISSSSSTKGGLKSDFISIWYDFISQGFNVITSTWMKPICFPVSPLSPGVWHHILLTFQPPKLTNVLSRKTVLGLCVDGRPLEVDLKVDSVPLLPTSKVHIGVPNAYLAHHGIVDGPLPLWEAGSALLISTILGPRDAMSIFAAGPDFRGQFWGDRPQRLSLPATATTIFSMLSECGERCSVAAALKRRNIVEIEAVSHILRDNFIDSESVNERSVLLSAAGLFCQLPPESVICALHPSSFSISMREGEKWNTKKHCALRLMNVAKVNSNVNASTDGIVYGAGSIISPNCFSDNVQWIGGPNVLLPIVNAAKTPTTLALSLRVIRESTHRHIPNLEMLQSGGGYRILSFLLHQKRIMNKVILEHCFAFGVHGFTPSILEIEPTKSSEQWVLVDPDAVKYLLMNHQVWHLQSSGPEFSTHLLCLLKGLVHPSSVHGIFNARRLHLLGIVKWTLHMMLEISELYTTGSIGKSISKNKDFEPRHANDVLGIVMNAFKNGWHNTDTLSITSTSVGGDPGMPLLLSCKILLRSILARMLTPEDLNDIAGAVIYTLSIDVMHEDVTSQLGWESSDMSQMNIDDDCNLRIGAVARIYLIRLLEELVVDGVDEISSTTGHRSSINDHNNEHNLAQLSSFTSSNTGKQPFMNRKKGQSGTDDIQKQKDHNAQLFLTAFSTVLTPAWFACVLQGCRDEASASTVFRLLIIMLQSSPSFMRDFQDAGAFTPLVLSIPKYSTSPSVMLSMLSQLLHAPILHLPSFGTLDAEQLCSIFDTESDAKELILHDGNKGGLRKSTDPSSGIFALLAECLGRNIQLGAVDNEMGLRARQTNEAVLRLLTHRHTFSSPFQEFCATSDFLEPLAQALCLVHSEKILGMESNEALKGKSRNSNQDFFASQNDLSASAGSQQSQSSGDCLDREDVLVDWPSSTNFDSLSQIDAEEPEKQVLRKGRLSTINLEVSPTVRFVGGGGDSTGIGLVRLLHHIIAHAVKSGPRAATLVDALFKSFPLHASPQEVEAFHLVLIDQCRSIVEEIMQKGSSGSLISFANCVGISTVLLDRLCKGFFSSEPTLATTNIILLTLQSISNKETYAFRILSKEDPDDIIRLNAAHFARMTVLLALQRSKPNGPLDCGDEILQQNLIRELCSNLDNLFFFNSDGCAMKNPDTATERAIWESCSLRRCSPLSLHVCVKYPEPHSVHEPGRAFIVSLMTELKVLLSSTIKPLRDDTALLIVSLLKGHQDIMSDILVQDIAIQGSSPRRIDLFHGGGFGALLHHNNEGNEVDESLESLRLQTFFDWLDVNEADINDVFDLIEKESLERISSVCGIQMPFPENAIEDEQKGMFINLSSKEASNQTILGTLNRSQLAQVSHEKTSESQDVWKRHGLDDLSSGAMQWKELLRQLKGSCSLWEGSSSPKVPIPMEESHNKGDQKKSEPLDVSDSCRVSHWKLDITEGYERQRRKLLPNYEFDTLYNVRNNSIELEENSHTSFGSSEIVSISGINENESALHTSGHFDFDPDDVEATAELLASIKVVKPELDPEDYEYDDDDDDVDEGEPKTNFHETEGTVSSSAIDSSSKGTLDIKFDLENNVDLDANDDDDEMSNDGYDENSYRNDEEIHDIEEERLDTQLNNYDLITGLLHVGDIPEKSYNVKRCTGLEVCPALLIRCRHAIYIIDGFEQTGEDGLRGNINRVEKSTSTFNVNLRPKGFQSEDAENSAGQNDEQNSDQIQKKNGRGLEKNKREERSTSTSESLFQHRCKRIALKDFYVVYRRRYQLKQLALEIYDVHNNGTFIAFTNRFQSEEVLHSLLNSTLPNSILKSGTSTNYDRFLKGLRTRITNMWVQGKMSNFDFLMHLNSFAGRSYNDLTQYPVFPWVIADYESEEIDLTNPKVYRDLSKPMGAIGAARAEQFRERYESLESHFLKKDDPPPFHYGTHYSCAAYVVNYLLRMEPFSRLALLLQGGKFDLPDRIFNDIGASWRSASQDNLQDVRELIPEFFYLPDFLENNNSFDFGSKQDGTTVHHVTLPPWAKGDPRRFVRINRQALESDIVSRQLHKWVDLIFGYKQRGREAVAALNTFVHVTYEGAVDIDSVKDDVQRDSIIAQIQNFGQTPSKLEKKPFPARNYLSLSKFGKNIDFNALPFLEPLTPPLCIVGAPQKVYLRVALQDTCKLGMTGQSDSACGDMCISRGQLIGVGKTCVLNIPAKKYYRFGGSNNGISVHVAIPSIKSLEVNKVATIYDDLHRVPLSAVKPSRNGQWLVTGCMDSTVRVWKHGKKRMELQATLCGHDGKEITCIDISTTFGTIVTGGADGRVLVWDLRTLSFLRRLDHPIQDHCSNLHSFGATQVTSVSLNDRTGDIVTLIGSQLMIFDINGKVIANFSRDEKFSENSVPCCAISTDCPEWMELGIVAVSGHKNGDIRLWGIDRDKGLLVFRFLISTKVHYCPITCLRLEGKRQDTLLAGDASGKMSVNRSLQLDSLSQQDFAKFMEGI